MEKNKTVFKLEDLQQDATTETFRVEDLVASEEDASIPVDDLLLKEGEEEVPTEAPGDKVVSGPLSPSERPLGLAEAAAFDAQLNARNSQALSVPDKIGAYILKGAENSLFFNALERTGYINVKDPTPAQKAYELPTGLNFVAQTAADVFTDPLLGPIMQGAGALVKGAPVVGKWFSKTLPLAEARALAIKELELGNVAAQDAVKTATKEYVRNRLKTDIVKGATEFGAYELNRGAAEQLHNKEFDFAKLVEKAGTGAVVGAVFGGAMGPLTRKVLGDRVMREAADGVETKFVNNFKINTDLEGAQIGEYLLKREAKLSALIEKSEAQIKLTDDKLRPKMQERLERLTQKLEETRAARNEHATTVTGVPDITEVPTHTPLAPVERTRLIKEAQDAPIKDLRARILKLDAQIKSPREFLMGEEVRGVETLKTQRAELERKLLKLQDQLTKRGNHLDSSITLKQANVAEKQLLALGKEIERAETRINNEIPKRSYFLEQERANLGTQLSAIEERAGRARETLNRGTRPLTAKERLSLIEERVDENERARKDVFSYHKRQAELLKAEKELEIQTLEARQRVVRPTVGTEKLSHQQARMEALATERVRVREGFLRLEKDFKEFLISKAKPFKWDIHTEQALFTDQAFSFAKAQIRQLIEKESVPRAVAEQLVGDLFVKLVERRGFNPKGALMKGWGGVVGELKNLLQPIHVLSRIDKITGTQSTRILHELAGANNVRDQIAAAWGKRGNDIVKHLMRKLGVDPKDVLRLMQHVEMADDGVSMWFNPDATLAESKNVRGVWTGPTPNDAIKEKLYELRQLFNEIHTALPNLGNTERFINGYIPIIRKTGAIPFKKTLNLSNVNPHELARKSGILDPDIHLTDIRDVLNRYIGRASSKIAFDRHIPDVITELNKMILMGESEGAAYFAENVAGQLGAGGSKGLSDALAEGLIRYNVEGLEKLFGVTEERTGVFSDILKLSKALLYRSLITTNQSTILLNFIQPEGFVPAEVGWRYLGRARKQLAFNSDARKFVSQFSKELFTVDTAMLEEAGNAQIKNPLIRFVDRAADLFTTPLKMAFDGGEKSNRFTAFLSGYLKFKDAGTPEEIMSTLNHLLPGERTAVISTLEKRGHEAAAQLFGKIINHRTNFIYSTINRPQFLRNTLGQAIPFTTWGLSAFSRYIEAVAQGIEGNYSPLVKRATAYMFFNSALRLMSGHEMENADPSGGNALVNFATSVFLPQFTVPIREAQKTAAVTGSNKLAFKTWADQSARHLLPYYNTTANIKRRLGKYGNLKDAVIPGKPIEARSWGQRILPKYLRK